MADFAIVIRLVRQGRPTLSTYFGKIGSIWQSGTHLRNREGLVEFIFNDTYRPVSPTELYIKMSAFGTQCVYTTEAHFRADLDKTLHEMFMPKQKQPKKNH
jgi:hypothetical protein